MKETIISEVGEKELIRILLTKRDQKLNSTDKKIRESYHDDAALIKNSSKYTVLSTDMLIQHTHFPKQMTPYQMGQKVVTVNASDIIAMNAIPDSILISMGLPPEMTLKDYNNLTDGIIDKCEELKMTLIGGDINQNNEIILCGTSTGKIDENIKLQANIKENNLIGVTGELGGPAAALDLLYNENIAEENQEKIIKTLLEPQLPLKTSEILRKYPKLTTSMTDITDGLAVELGHLHEKNPNIGFEINFDKIPYDKKIEKIAKINNKEITEYLLHFGEEFELLVILDKDEYEKHKDKLDNIYIIGKTNNSNNITLIKYDNEETIPLKGYEHLKDD